jgi:hypothetical protein
MSNDSFFMQVTAAPVSNRQEKVLFPALTANLVLILSRLKGVIISNSLLQVAMEIVHKLRINCGMTLGAWMRGVISLMSKNPAAVPVDLFLSLLITVAGHIHFRPVGTSSSVSARFVLMDSFPAFVLSVVQYLAIEAVLAIPVGVVASSGLKLFVVRLHIVGFLGCVGKFHVPLVLEGGNLVLVLPGVGVAFLVNGGNGFQ